METLAKKAPADSARTQRSRASLRAIETRQSDVARWRGESRIRLTCAASYLAYLCMHAVVELKNHAVHATERFNAPIPHLEPTRAFIAPYMDAYAVHQPVDDTAGDEVLLGLLGAEAPLAETPASLEPAA